MPHLVISLFGPMQVHLAEKSVTTFESNRVRALLAYLSVEAAQPHHRQKLAASLWPEWPDAAARKNLRSALPNLRKAIGDYQADPPFLLITRETLQFNPASNAQLDVTVLLEVTESASTATIQQVEAAIDLYKGEFLEGFSLSDSPPFEEWLLMQREDLHRQVLTALQHTTDHYEQVGDTLRACDLARRQIALDNFREEAHRQLMRLLSIRGETSAALAHFEQFQNLVVAELSAQPAPETVELYTRIKDGSFDGTRSGAIQLWSGAKNPVTLSQPQADALPLPPYLINERPHQGINETPFVARQKELSQLSAHLAAALAGQGQVLFISGDAGSGKTKLFYEFTRIAQAKYLNLLATGGACSARTGEGDPYLPFREIISLLTGDLESIWLAGNLTREQATRLWSTLPQTIQHLIHKSPALIGSFVRGESLLKHLSTEVPDEVSWLSELRSSVEKRHHSAEHEQLQQSDLFEQTTAFFLAIATHQPLLLMLDDLHWADAGSLNLLFHLGRHITGYPILIVGTYRPEEVAAGRNNERHPLEPLLYEFGRLWGTRPIDLNAADGRQFVDALVNSTPNRLDATFRELLFQRSAGHALFTTELVEEMQRRGDLLQDAQGYWVEADSLKWEATPARIDAVIGERINRLSSNLRQALSIASVEGETFVAEIVAQLLNIDERELIGLLSRELDRKHNLIQVRGVERVNGQRLSLYHFRHILFQEFLYDTLDEAERIYWHNAMANALERCYNDLVNNNISYATQLARHFQLAADFNKAVHYFTCAGCRAVELFANEEAIAHFTDALSLLAMLPEDEDGARRELQIEEDLSIAMGIVCGHAAPIVESHLVRTEELARELGNASKMFLAAWRLWQYYHVRGELYSAQSRAQRLMNYAERTRERIDHLAASQAIGNTAFAMGKLSDAIAHIEESLIPLSPEEQHDYIHKFGIHPAVLSRIFLALTECCRGYPDLAVRYIDEALSLAERSEHPFSISFALLGTCGVHLLRRDPRIVLHFAEKIIAYCSKYGITQWVPQGIYIRGWAVAMLHKSLSGLEEAQNGFRGWQKTGSSLWGARMRAVLADTCLQVGHIEGVDELIAEALRYVDSAGEHLYEAELYRLKGVLLLQARTHSPDSEITVEAERYFLQAIAIAQQQAAKLWELRAINSLSRFYIEQGRLDEAKQRLTTIYDWFTEGYDFPDLLEAKALLDQLSE